MFLVRLNYGILKPLTGKINHINMRFSASFLLYNIIILFRIYMHIIIRLKKCFIRPIPTSFFSIVIRRAKRTRIFIQRVGIRLRKIIHRKLHFTFNLYIKFLWRYAWNFWIDLYFRILLILLLFIFFIYYIQRMSLLLLWNNSFHLKLRLFFKRRSWLLIILLWQLLILILIYTWIMVKCIKLVIIFQRTMMWLIVQIRIVNIVITVIIIKIIGLFLILRPNFLTILRSYIIISIIRWVNILNDIFIIILWEKINIIYIILFTLGFQPHQWHLFISKWLLGIECNIYRS